MKRKAMWIPALILAAALPLAGCLNGAQEDTEYSFPDMAFPGAASDTAEVTAAPTADTSDMDFTFDEDEEEEQEALEQAENVDLGSDSILEITKGGSYTLTGEQNGMSGG